MVQPPPRTNRAASAAANGSMTAAMEQQDARDQVDLGYGPSRSIMASPAATDANQDEQLSPVKKAGLFGTSSNLVNTIVGAGIIGIPYAFKQSGFIAGLVLLVFVGFLTDKSLRMMIDMARFHPLLKDRHVTSFERLAWYPFGSWGKFFILLNMFIMAYGAMVAYLLIIKDTVPTLLGVGFDTAGRWEREMILIVTSLLIMLPLSMQRDMATLAITSFLSVSADAILVVFIMAFSPVQESIASAGGLGKVFENDSIRPTIFIGLGVLSTAMACQHSAFIVSGSLNNLTRHRWSIVTGCSISLATLLCAILGSTGYLGFLDSTQGDVLNNFPEAGAFANAARALLAITMFFTYPMESFVGRHVLAALLFGGDMGEKDDSTCCNRRHMLTLGLYIMSMIPALIFTDLGPVLSITGSVGGSCIAYIAPGVVFFGVNGRAFLDFCHDKVSRRRESRKVGGQIELPVAGDANRAMRGTAPASYGGSRQSSSGNLQLPVAGESVVLESQVLGSKPCWWYFLGFPIWYAIARSGASTMNYHLEHEEESDGDGAEFQPVNSPSRQSTFENEAYCDESLSCPSGRDYCVAAVFICFGFLAGIAGLVTNVYVQIYGLKVYQKI